VFTLKGNTAGYSDQVKPCGRVHRLTNKRYIRDNRLIFLASPYGRKSLAPRCRLVATWSWKRFQGLGCSPSNAVHELGSERCETVRSQSIVNKDKKKKTLPLVREDQVKLTYSLLVIFFLKKSIAK